MKNRIIRFFERLTKTYKGVIIFLGGWSNS